MKKHVDSHMDHGFTSEQWDYIFAKYSDKMEFFIDTFELPENLGTVTNELYGPSVGDSAVPESAVFYARRGDRSWNSRLVKLTKRPTRFVRVIAGPHETMKCPDCGVASDNKYGSSYDAICTPCDRVFTAWFPCILYTAYGVASLNMPAAPKEPGDLKAALNRLLVAKNACESAFDVDPAAFALACAAVSKAQLACLEAEMFWAQHALAASLAMIPCSTCGTPNMGDAVYDGGSDDDSRRCQTCGTL